MRFARHLLIGALFMVVLLLGAVAFALYDPFSSGPRWLTAAQLITAPPDLLHPVAEPVVSTTDPPWLATLALRYQPTLVVSGYDRFWPTSLASIMSARWDGHRDCLYFGGRCHVPGATPAALSGPGARSDWVQMASPMDSITDSFDAVATVVGLSRQVVHGWPGDIRRENPFPSAEIYFYYLARTRAHSYPGVPRGLISLEYWFFYPLNYFPLVRIPLLALRDPVSSTLGNTDYHQGDLEHVAVLIDPRTMHPRYLWMARHADEGQLYRWHSPDVQWDGEHPTIYAALGSHTSYAHCGIQRRSRTYLFINDYVVCIPHRTFGFTPAATPLIDLAHTSWGCWRGHLGQAGHHLLTGLVGLTPYETDGPYSPLQQQENFAAACHVAPGTPRPAAAL